MVTAEFDEEDRLKRMLSEMESTDDDLLGKRGWAFPMTMGGEFGGDTVRCATFDATLSKKPLARGLRAARKVKITISISSWRGFIKLRTERMVWLRTLC